jgi:L-rhamnonate dehydratase
MLAPDASEVIPMFSPLFADEPVPEGGRMRASSLDRPGFGVELSASLELQRPFTAD